MVSQPTPIVPRTTRGPTRDRILDAAEHLFSARGIDATSLRAITTEAAVNVAAIHYHFGSREALVREVLARRVAPVNSERLARLERLERAAPEKATLEALLKAFVAPAFEAAATQPDLSRLMGRLFSEPPERVRGLTQELFEEVMARFHRAFSAKLAHLDSMEVLDRLRFSVGVMVDVLMQRHPDDVRGVRGTPGDNLAGLVAFLAGGFRAPSQVDLP